LNTIASLTQETVDFVEHLVCEFQLPLRDHLLDQRLGKRITQKDGSPDHNDRNESYDQNKFLCDFHERFIEKG
jgi:hypothetical protein